MVNHSNGTERTSATQKRRVMLVSSVEGSSVAAGVTSSNVMPQIGQEPGFGNLICECIGHV